MEPQLTGTLDVWEDDAHGTAIQYSLHKAITALVWHMDEWCYPTEKAGAAQAAGIINGKCRVLKVDKQAVKTGALGKLDYLRIGDQSNPKILHFVNRWL